MPESSDGRQRTVNEKNGVAGAGTRTEQWHAVEMKTAAAGSAQGHEPVLFGEGAGLPRVTAMWRRVDGGIGGGLLGGRASAG